MRLSYVRMLHNLVFLSSVRLGVLHLGFLVVGVLRATLEHCTGYSSGIGFSDRKVL
jgi:hypothetical protein